MKLNIIKKVGFTLCALSLCVYLSAQDVKELVIYHTNDTHSKIEPYAENFKDTSWAGKAGYVRRATFMKEARKENKDVLLFDCGDFSQGSPYYNMFKGEVEVCLMNEMGYDAGTIGNHEFDFGLDNMLRLFKMAKFPIVCANYDFTGTVLEGVVKPYIIIERNGLKIGVFGLSPRMEGLVQAANCEGVVYNEPNAAANEVADLLKNKEGCDAVICLSHLGWKSGPLNPASDENLIANTRNIDVVLGGHSHSLFVSPEYYKNLDGKEVSNYQMGKSAVYVGKMVLKFVKK